MWAAVLRQIAPKHKGCCATADLPHLNIAEVSWDGAAILSKVAGAPVCRLYSGTGWQSSQEVVKTNLDFGSSFIVVG